MKILLAVAALLVTLPAVAGCDNWEFNGYHIGMPRTEVLALRLTTPAGDQAVIASEPGKFRSMITFRDERTIAITTRYETQDSDMVETALRHRLGSPFNWDRYPHPVRDESGVYTVKRTWWRNEKCDGMAMLQVKYYGSPSMTVIDLNVISSADVGKAVEDRKKQTDDILK